VTRLVETRFSVEVDSVSRAAWYERVAEFSDGNLNQLWLWRTAIFDVQKKVRRANRSHLIRARRALVV
jgi:hypothetical protein